MSVINYVTSVEEVVIKVSKGQRAIELLDFYLSQVHVATVSAKDYRSYKDSEEGGRVFLRDFKAFLKELKISYKVPKVKLVIPDTQVYKDEFISKVKPGMAADVRSFRLQHAANSKLAYLNAERIIAQLELLVPWSAITDDSNLAQEDMRLQQDSKETQLAIQRGTMESNFTAWNIAIDSIDKHDALYAKELEEAIEKAVLQENADHDALQRMLEAERIAKTGLMQMIRNSPPDIGKLMHNLEFNGSDPFKTNDFYTLIERLDMKYGALDTYGLITLLVKFMNFQQGSQSLAVYNDKAIHFGNQLKEALKKYNGIISTDTLLAISILRGLDPPYMEKYLNVVTQLMLSRKEKDTSNSFDIDDNGSVQSMLDGESNILTGVQNFIQSEIRKEYASATMAGMLLPTVPSVSHRRTPEAQVVCSVTESVVNRTKHDPTFIKNMNARYHVCNVDFAKPGSCPKGSACEGFHFAKGTFTSDSDTYCGRHLKGLCVPDVNGVKTCSFDHKTPISGKLMGVFLKSNSSPPSSSTVAPKSSTKNVYAALFTNYSESDNDRTSDTDDASHIYSLATIEFSATMNITSDVLLVGVNDDDDRSAYTDDTDDPSLVESCVLDNSGSLIDTIIFNPNHYDSITDSDSDSSEQDSFPPGTTVSIFQLSRFSTLDVSSAYFHYRCEPPLSAWSPFDLSFDHYCYLDIIAQTQLLHSNIDTSDAIIMPLLCNVIMFPGEAPDLPDLIDESDTVASLNSQYRIDALVLDEAFYSCTVAMEVDLGASMVHPSQVHSDSDSGVPDLVDDIISDSESELSDLMDIVYVSDVPGDVSQSTYGYFRIDSDSVLPALLVDDSDSDDDSIVSCVISHSFECFAKDGIDFDDLIVPVPSEVSPHSNSDVASSVHVYDGSFTIGMPVTVASLSSDDSDDSSFPDYDEGDFLMFISRALPTVPHLASFHKNFDPAFRAPLLPSRIYSAQELAYLFSFIDNLSQLSKGDHHNKFFLLRSAIRRMLRDNKPTDSLIQDFSIIHAYLDYLQQVHVTDFLVCIPMFVSHCNTRYGLPFSKFLSRMVRAGDVSSFQRCLDALIASSLLTSPVTKVLFEDDPSTISTLFTGVSEIISTVPTLPSYLPFTIFSLDRYSCLQYFQHPFITLPTVHLAILRFYYELVFSTGPLLDDAAILLYSTSCPTFSQYVFDEGLYTFHAAFWNTLLEESLDNTFNQSESLFDLPYMELFHAYYADAYPALIIPPDIASDILLRNTVDEPSTSSIARLRDQSRSALMELLCQDSPSISMLHRSADSVSSPIYSSTSLDPNLPEPTSPFYSITAPNSPVAPLPYYSPIHPVQPSLLVRPSGLFLGDPNTGRYTVSIGRGLITENRIAASTRFISFNGEVISTSERKRRTAAGRGMYMLKKSKHYALDCFLTAASYECVASYANSPSNCWNSRTNAAAVANCKLIYYQGVFYLSSLRDIDPGEEILYSYGSCYIFPGLLTRQVHLAYPLNPNADLLTRIYDLELHVAHQQEILNRVPNADLLQRIQELEQCVDLQKGLLASILVPGTVQNPIAITDDSNSSLDIGVHVLQLTSVDVDGVIDDVSDSLLATPASVLSITRSTGPTLLGWDSLSAISVSGSFPLTNSCSPIGPGQAIGIGGLARILEQGLCPELDPSLTFYKLSGNKQNILSLGCALQPTAQHQFGGFALFTAAGALRGNLTESHIAKLIALMDEIALSGNIVAEAKLMNNVYYQTISSSTESCVSSSLHSPPSSHVVSPANLPYEVNVTNTSIYGGRVRTKNIDQLISFLNATGLSQSCIIAAIDKGTVLGFPPHITTAEVNSYFTSIGKNTHQILADITSPPLRRPIDYESHITIRPGTDVVVDAFSPPYSRYVPLHSPVSATTPARRPRSVVVPSVHGGFKDAVLAYDPHSGYATIKGRISPANPHLIVDHFVDLWIARWASLQKVKTDSSFVTEASINSLSKRSPPIILAQAPPGDHRKVTSSVEGVIRWIQQGGQANHNRLRLLVKDGLISEQISRSFWFHATVQSLMTWNMNPAFHDSTISRLECGTGIRANLSYQVLLPFGMPIIGKSLEPHSMGRGEEGLYLGPSMLVTSGILFYNLSTGKLSIKYAFSPTPRDIPLDQRSISLLSNQLFGSEITLLAPTVPTLVDITPVAPFHNTRSVNSNFRDHMVNVVSYTVTPDPQLIVLDDSIIDIASRGPKPVPPSNKQCMFDPLWHAADKREIDKLLQEQTFLPLPRNRDGSFIRPPHAIVLPLLRVREYKWKADPDTAIMRWLECVRLVVNGSHDKRITGEFYASTPDRTLLFLFISIECSQLAYLATGDVERAYLNALSLDTNIVVLAPRDLKGLDAESLMYKGQYGSRKAALGWEVWIENKLTYQYFFQKLAIARGVYVHAFSDTGDDSDIVSINNNPFFDIMNFTVDQDLQTSVSLLPDGESLVDTPYIAPAPPTNGSMKLLRHSDDFLSASTNMDLQKSMHLKIESGIRMSPFTTLTQFLGCEFFRYNTDGVLDPINGSICLVFQREFIRNMAIEFQSLRALFNPKGRKRNHPVPVNAMLSEEDMTAYQISLLTPSQVTIYQKAVGSINWLVCSTRPESKFGCFLVATRLASPRNWDMYLAMYLMDFIIGTINIPLVLGGPIIDPVLYADASFAVMSNKRSICSHLVMSGEGSGCIYAHISSPKSAVTSIFEAELIAGNNAATTAIYITKACQEMHHDIPTQRVIYVDNEAEIHWINGSVSNKRSKHVDIRMYASRHLQEQGYVLFKFIGTEYQLADILTKALSVPIFRHLAFYLLGHGLIAHFKLEGIELYNEVMSHLP